MPRGFAIALSALILAGRLVDTLSGTQACALSGAATVIADGSVWFGATAHCLLTPDVGKTVQFGGQGSSDFSAATHVDRDGDGTVDNSDGWAPISSSAPSGGSTARRSCFPDPGRPRDQGRRGSPASSASR